MLRKYFDNRPGVTSNGPRGASLVRRTVAWAWTRDEVAAETTRATVLYTVVMYATALLLITLTGVLLTVSGYETTGFGFLLFGIGFTSFIGAINIGWELLKYRSDSRDEADEPPDDGPQRALAPDLRLAEDTKIGFVLTVVGLVVLVVSFEVAQWLIAWL